MNGARLIAAGSAAVLAGVVAAALPASASEPPPPNGAQQFTTGGFEDRSCQFGFDVEGNRAGFVWQVEETSDQSFQGLYEHFSVRDNGPPGQGIPDMVVSAPNTPAPPPSCAPLAETVPVLKGNIVVHDTTP